MTGLGGSSLTPSARRTNDKTITIRVKLVTVTRIAGNSDKTVKRTATPGMDRHEPIDIIGSKCRGVTPDIAQSTHPTALEWMNPAVGVPVDRGLDDAIVRNRSCGERQGDDGAQHVVYFVARAEQYAARSHVRRAFWATWHAVATTSRESAAV